MELIRNRLSLKQLLVWFFKPKTGYTFYIFDYCQLDIKLSLVYLINLLSPTTQHQRIPVSGTATMGCKKQSFLVKRETLTH